MADERQLAACALHKPDMLEQVWAEFRQHFDDKMLANIVDAAWKYRQITRGMLSRETFDLILMRMAEALMEYVTDPEILEKIQLRWSKISVETSAKRGRITEHAN